MALIERIESHLSIHLDGLIDGERLRSSEIAHWVELLLMAEEHKAPVKRARFFGFTFISRVSHIREAINYLTYQA